MFEKEFTRVERALDEHPILQRATWGAGEKVEVEMIVTRDGYQFRARVKVRGSRKRKSDEIHSGWGLHTSARVAAEAFAATLDSWAKVLKK